MNDKENNKQNYNQLSQSTHDRHLRELKKIHELGYTLTEIKKKSDSELRSIYNSKAKSMNPYRRLFNQISKNPQVRELVKQNTIEYYKNHGYNQSKIDKLEKDLNRTVGTIFFEIASALKEAFKEKEKDSYKHAKALLSIPQEAYDELEQVEIDILRANDY